MENRLGASTFCRDSGCNNKVYSFLKAANSYEDQKKLEQIKSAAEFSYFGCLLGAEISNKETKDGAFRLCELHPTKWPTEKFITLIFAHFCLIFASYLLRTSFVPPSYLLRTCFDTASEDTERDTNHTRT